MEAVLRKGSRTGDYVGVACLLADERYYFSVGPDGTYVIDRDPGGNGARVELTAGVDSRAIKGFQ